MRDGIIPELSKFSIKPRPWVCIINPFVIHFLDALEMNASLPASGSRWHTRIRVPGSYRVNLRAKSNQVDTKISTLHVDISAARPANIICRHPLGSCLIIRSNGTGDAGTRFGIATCYRDPFKWEWARNKWGNVHIVMHLSEEICLRHPWKLETR